MMHFFLCSFQIAVKVRYEIQCIAACHTVETGNVCRRSNNQFRIIECAYALFANFCRFECSSEKEYDSIMTKISFISSLLLKYLQVLAKKLEYFGKIAITFLTLAQNPFNYSKRFNIILEINEGKLVHNYGNFNYKYMYFFKNAFFLEFLFNHR